MKKCKQVRVVPSPLAPVKRREFLYFSDERMLKAAARAVGAPAGAAVEVDNGIYTDDPGYVVTWVEGVADDAETLERLEDAADLRAAKKARADVEKHGTVSLTSITKGLGE